jgi:hypothetical protein
MAIVAAGSNNPPMPRPATAPKAVVFAGISELLEASEPEKQLCHFY